jgi:hypothetical protein
MNFSLWPRGQLRGFSFFGGRGGDCQRMGGAGCIWAAVTGAISCRRLPLRTTAN